LYALGNLAFWQGDHGAATTNLQASLDLHRQLENRAGEGFAHLGLGIVAWGDGDLDRSAELLRVASDVLDQEEEAWGAARARTYMTWVGMVRDDPDSKERAEASLAEAQALGDLYHINLNTLTLGVLAHKEGDLERAQALYQKALASCREMGDRMGEAYYHGWLGILARHRGNLPQAREYLQRAEDLFRRDSYADAHRWIKINQSITARLEADITDAVEALQEALVIGGRTGNPRPIGVLRETASLMAEVGLPERSAVLYGAAAALGGPPPLPGSPWRTEYDQDMEMLRAQLDTDSLDQAWAKGGAQNPAEAFDEAATALEELQTSSDRFERKPT
jgi:tetratricopeptide (TPR) repeat protein